MINVVAKSLLFQKNSFNTWHFNDAFGNTFYMLKSEFYATMKFDPTDGILCNKTRPTVVPTKSDSDVCFVYNC